MTNQSSLSIEISEQLPPSGVEALTVCVFADEPHAASSLDDETRRVVEKLASDGEFKGEAESSLILHLT